MFKLLEIPLPKYELCLSVRHLPQSTYCNWGLETTKSPFIRSSLNQVGCCSSLNHLGMWIYVSYSTYHCWLVIARSYTTCFLGIYIYNIHTDYIYYLVGGFEHVLFSPIAGMIQSDFPIFQRDWNTLKPPTSYICETYHNQLVSWGLGPLFEPRFFGITSRDAGLVEPGRLDGRAEGDGQWSQEMRAMMFGMEHWTCNNWEI